MAGNARVRRYNRDLVWFMTELDIHFAEILWDYHRIEQELVRSDIIIGLGSYDTRVASHCAELLEDDWAPLVIFTGAEGNFTRGKWEKSEAETFADVAIAAGTDPEKILIEPTATNTGENFRFTRKLCEERNIPVLSSIVVSKPNMNRRAHATSLRYWPELEVCFSHPKTHFLRSPAEGHRSEDVIHEIVGDMQRVLEYPALGYQEEQNVPAEVHDAYRSLVKAGYTEHMML